jgi:MscS family membrane protein
MIGEMLSFLNSWIKDFGLLSQTWRAGILVFVLVLGTATVAFIVSRIILALERKFAKTSNIWDDAILHSARKPAIAFVWLQGIYWAA